MNYVHFRDIGYKNFKKYFAIIDFSVINIEKIIIKSENFF